MDALQTGTESRSLAFCDLAATNSIDLRSLPLSLSLSISLETCLHSKPAQSQPNDRSNEPNRTDSVECTCGQILCPFVCYLLLSDSFGRFTAANDLLLWQTLSLSNASLSVHRRAKHTIAKQNVPLNRKLSRDFRCQLSSTRLHPSKCIAEVWQVSSVRSVEFSRSDVLADIFVLPERIPFRSKIR